MIYEFNTHWFRVRLKQGESPIHKIFYSINRYVQLENGVVEAHKVIDGHTA